MYVVMKRVSEKDSELSREIVGLRKMKKREKEKSDKERVV